MEVRKFIIFYKYTMQGYSALPPAVFQKSYNGSSKIYYEFVDSLLIIPD